MASLTLKVQFKSGQSKTLRFRANMSIAEAARMIAQREVSCVAAFPCRFARCVRAAGRQSRRPAERLGWIFFFLILTPAGDVAASTATAALSGRLRWCKTRVRYRSSAHVRRLRAAISCARDLLALPAAKHACQRAAGSSLYCPLTGTCA